MVCSCGFSAAQVVRVYIPAPLFRFKAVPLGCFIRVSVTAPTPVIPAVILKLYTRNPRCPVLGFLEFSAVILKALLDPGGGFISKSETAVTQPFLNGSGYKL